LRSATRLLAATGTLLLAGRAHANPTSRLIYVRSAGAESCPDEPEMRRAVATRLGYDPFRLIASTTLTAEVRRDGGAFRGRVKLVDDAGVERGTRQLESRATDCRELTAAMALSMSIAIDPLSVLRPPAPETQRAVELPAEATASAPEAAPAVPVEPVAESERSAVPPRDEARKADPLRLVVAAGPHLGFGIAPATNVGVRVSVGAATQRVQLGFEGRFDLAASAESSEGGRSRTSLAGAALVPCVRASFFWGCGVVLLARVAAEALDVTEPRGDAFAYLGAGGRVAVPVTLPQGFTVDGVGDLLGHPAPFVLTLNGRRVYRSSAVSGALGLALTKIF